MDKPAIEELFDSSRFNGGSSSILLFFYFPLGLVLAILRIFIGVQLFILSCILPKFHAVRSVILRIICCVLGIVVTTDNSENRKKDVRVLVTNHVSPLDHLAVDLVYPSIMPSVWDLPGMLMWMLGYRDMGAKRGRAVLIEKAKEHCEESPIPLLSHPEGATTNGKKGLLKFSTWSFSLDQPVQPIVIVINRPLIGINISTLGSRWWQDVFWFFFSPFTVFHLRVLPAMYKGESEDFEEFTKRVQDTMAPQLHLTTTFYTSADKVEYAKKVLFNPHLKKIDITEMCIVSNSLCNHRHLDRLQSLRHHHHYQHQPIVMLLDRFSVMASQVKEVLPHVPEDVIRKDLEKTSCVDTTISRILEGQVHFVPIDTSPSSGDGEADLLEGATAMPSGTSTPLTPSPSATQFSASHFSRSANERQMSFEERKQALYDTARR
ncbi:LOW QUALITY PROTEIN: lipid droplet-regulating VLDL assembly factor AUP1 homolog [Saccoglossus kowalevskii]